MDVCGCGRRACDVTWPCSDKGQVAAGVTSPELFNFNQRSWLTERLPPIWASTSVLT